MKPFEHFESLKVILDGPLVTLTLNRPDKFNALNHQVLTELGETFDWVERSAARVVLVTGAGEKSFCSGADLNELEHVDFQRAFDFLRHGQQVMEKIHQSCIPVIAAVNGYALGGGMELAMACHLRVSSDNAQFGLPEAKLGMIPAFGGTQRLPRLVGYAKATEWMLTGSRISAAEAQAAGLVNRVVPLAELMPEVHSLAVAIANNSPVSVEMVLHSLRTGMDVPMERALLVERFAGAAAASSADQREGIRAFMSRQTPRFHGWRQETHQGGGIDK